MGLFLSFTKFNLARWFGIRSGSKALLKKKKPAPTLKPQLLCLEERVTPATYTVTSAFDFDRPGDLRNAITQANASREDDTIIFSNVQHIGLLSQLPAIRDSRAAGTLTITGIDPRERRQLPLDITGDTGNANRDFRAFRVEAVGNLTLSGISISGFRRLDNGGAILNDGTLTLNNCTILNNSSISAGTLFNPTRGDGGGICNSNVGTLTVTNSTISHNIGANGGGLYNGNILFVTNSTIASNTAVAGGGIFGLGQFGSLNVTNSTIASNIAKDGGGIINNSPPGPVGRPDTRRPNPNHTTLQNTILANNVFGDYFGTPPSNSSNNLVSDGTLTVGATRGNPLLGPLQDNGGPTFTMALGAGSPAIGAGNRAISNASPINGRDQRGFTRVTSDIGAVAFGGIAPRRLVTGTSSDSGSALKEYDFDQTELSVDVEKPFPGFTGEIHVASGDYNGDFNGDGIGDIIAGAGEGGGPAVAILDSQTGRVLRSFFAFDPSFRGGVNVASIDHNGDGVMDIVVGAGPGGGPHVKVFNGVDLEAIASFFAYGEDFRGGVSIAALDFNGDGVRDLVTGAGPGGGPHVKVFDGGTQALISQWFAYGAEFNGGVNVAGGDLNNDGNIEVVTGAGTGGGPEVAVWNPLTGESIGRFLGYSSDFTGGVHVAVADGNGDGLLEIITGAGKGGSPHVKGFSPSTLDLLFEFFAGDPTDTDGVFVS